MNGVEYYTDLYTKLQFVREKYASEHITDYASSCHSRLLVKTLDEALNLLEQDWYEAKRSVNYNELSEIKRNNKELYGEQKN